MDVFVTFYKISNTTLYPIGYILIIMLLFIPNGHHSNYFLSSLKNTLKSFVKIKENLTDNNQYLGMKKAAFLIEKRLFKKWAHLGSNQGPKDYESSTLTS